MANNTCVDCGKPLAPLEKSCKSCEEKSLKVRAVDRTTGKEDYRKSVDINRSNSDDNPHIERTIARGYRATGMGAPPRSITRLEEKIAAKKRRKK